MEEHIELQISGSNEVSSSSDINVLDEKDTAGDQRKTILDKVSHYKSLGWDTNRIAATLNIQKSEI